MIPAFKPGLLLLGESAMAGLYSILAKFLWDADDSSHLAPPVI